MKVGPETDFRRVEAYLNSVAEKLYARLIQSALAQKEDLPFVSVREMRERIRRAVTGFCDYILGACTLGYRLVSLTRPIHFRAERQSEERVIENGVRGDP